MKNQIINFKEIPNKPGVYLWKDKHGVVLYVGKAKNLNSRMKQYFNSDISYKTKLLQARIDSYDIKITSNEIDAFLLEQQLINKYEPKYNLKIKYAGSYPYIELKTTPRIKLSIARNVRNKHSKYYGPFPDTFSPKKVITFLQSLLPINECRNPKSGTPCLLYQMGLCMGECIGQVDPNKKETIIKEIEDFFNGKVSKIKKLAKNKMQLYSDNQQYENALKMKELISTIDKYKDKQHIISTDNKNRDVLGFYKENGYLSVCITYIRFGKVINSKYFLRPDYAVSLEESINNFVSTYYKDNLVPDDIYVPCELINEQLKWNIPFKGRIKELMTLNTSSAKKYYENEKDRLEHKKKQYETAIDSLKKVINIEKLSKFELVDVSHFSGDSQVGVVVAFENGIPTKSLYRKYIINGDELNSKDDYLSIKQIVYRHFRRKLIDKIPKPDVLIVDGKNEVKYAKEALKELNIDLTCIGLIKNKRHDTESIFINNKIINLNNRNEMYILLGNMQDEVHRFAISFNKKRRDDKIFNSELDKYKFLTKIDKDKLFKGFKTMREIKKANKKDLIRTLGLKKGNLLFESLNN